MTTEAMPVHGPVAALVERLRAHAEAHEYIANADPEQKQWMNDLYDAADEIEKLRCLLHKLTSSNVTYWDGRGEVRHDVGTTQAEAMMIFREARKMVGKVASASSKGVTGYSAR